MPVINYSTKVINDLSKKHSISRLKDSLEKSLLMWKDPTMGVIRFLCPHYIAYNSFPG